VGDDDQNIFEFRGSSAAYLEQFIKQKKAVTHELIENFRSKNNMVEFTNSFASLIQHRLKKTPIVSAHASNGTLRIINYNYGNLITPVVNDLLTAELAGTTCILTRTNEEAQQITGLLVHYNIPAKLIQSNDEFNLYHLAELRFFINTIKSHREPVIISDQVWLQAIKDLQQHFGTSNKIDLCMNLIREFESIYPKKKYQTDLEIFIRESKLEDFFAFNSDTIFVSTMHKAKGKEFDNIYLMLENYKPSSDEAKRTLYVAMTRAKNNLVIHYNGRYLDRIFAENIHRASDSSQYELPLQLAVHLNHKDVWLDYFSGRQNIISALRSGDVLQVNDDTCLNGKGQKVLKFSRHFLDFLETRQKEGYTLGQVKVNFIIYWKKEDTPEEIKIVLPEVTLNRVRS
jgi:ATP-dependent DNA helicase RecQ